MYKMVIKVMIKWDQVTYRAQCKVQSTLLNIDSITFTIIIVVIIVVFTSIFVTGIICGVTTSNCIVIIYTIAGIMYHKLWVALVIIVMLLHCLCYFDHTQHNLSHKEWRAYC